MMFLLLYYPAISGSKSIMLQGRLQPFCFYFRGTICRVKSSEFIRALPEALRARLDGQWRGIKAASRSWLAQFYFDDPAIHYEVSNLGERRARIEVGLHFESRTADVNRRWLEGMSAHLIEIKARLGVSFEAEPWDRGWTKVYETIFIEGWTREELDRVAARMAEVIAVLEPIRRDVDKRPRGKQ